VGAYCTPEPFIKSSLAPPVNESVNRVDVEALVRAQVERGEWMLRVKSDFHCNHSNTNALMKRAAESKFSASSEFEALSEVTPPNREHHHHSTGPLFN